jgi:hypothetical protein
MIIVVPSNRTPGGTPAKGVFIGAVRCAGRAGGKLLAKTLPTPENNSPYGCYGIKTLTRVSCGPPIGGARGGLSTPSLT